MKRILFYLITISLLAIVSCSDDSTGTITDPFGGGGAGGGSVTFSIGNQILQEGYDFDGDGQADDSFYLTVSPSVAVKITKVKIEIPNNTSFDEVEGDGTTVFNANEAVYLNSTPYYSVTTGQKFTLKFSGKLSSNDQAFDITTEYTVP